MIYQTGYYCFLRIRKTAKVHYQAATAASQVSSEYRRCSQFFKNYIITLPTKYNKKPDGYKQTDGLSIIFIWILEQVFKRYIENFSDDIDFFVRCYSDLSFQFGITCRIDITTHDLHLGYEILLRDSSFLTKTFHISADDIYSTVCLLSGFQKYHRLTDIIL